MNKKLVILIVFVMMILSVTVVAVMGSEAYGNYAQKQVKEIYFVKDDGSYYEDNAKIQISKDVDAYTIRYVVLPEDADDKQIKVISNNPEIATAYVDGDTIRIAFHKNQPVDITIRSRDMGKMKTIKFILKPINEGDPI